MHHDRRFFVALAVVLVLAVAVFALAGCGSTTTTTTAAASTTTAAPASSDTSAAAASGTSGTLVVKGLVDKPATWTAADLQKLNPVTMTATHPKKGDTQYTGVKLADLFKLLAVQAAAKTLVTSSSDGFTSEVALSDIAAAPDAMLAIGDDGKLNMVMPGMSGKAWATDVTSWEFK
jgi:hypothetical protein